MRSDHCFRKTNNFYISYSSSGHWFVVVSVLCLVAGLWSTSIASSEDSTKHWVGTWACAPYPMGSNNSNFPPTITNNTARQVVRVSIGGDTLRVRFSNEETNSSTTLNAVNIAVSPDGTKSPITEATITPLQFNGNTSITMKAREIVTSDPVAFDLEPSARIAITIYYGSAGNGGDMTGHVASRTDSYVAAGDQSENATFTGSVKTTRHWFHIIGIDVLAPKTAVAVAAIGNSITDGAGVDAVTAGLQNRWTDRFSEALLANEATREVGVLNLGIGATLATTSGVSRFGQDVLGQSGLHWVIIFYGVNDINGGRSANDIFNAIKKMANDAHAKDTSIKVYGGTITPFYGHSYYSPGHEATRNQINDMIRTSTDLDGYIDFAEAIADPNDPSRMKQEYKEGGWNDGLHPGPAGHEAMGKCIDLEMFTPPPVKAITIDEMNHYTLKNAGVAFTKGNSAVVVDLHEELLTSFKIFTICGKQIMEYNRSTSPSAGEFIIPLGGKRLAKGTYVYELATDGGRVHRNRIITGDSR